MSGTAHADEASVSNLLARSDTEVLSLYRYKPFYFLLGSPDTKIQISFKAKILRETELYIGYSQIMMWDIFKTSAPMRDLNYNPEIFYRFSLSDRRPEQWLDFGIYEHESNGLAGDGSRSWNRTSLRYHSSTTFTHDSRLLWSIKAWIPYLYDSTSPDIPKYRGVWELNMEFCNIMGGFVQPGDVLLRIYPGGASYTNPLKGGQEITLRMKSRWQGFLMPIMVQFFHGYAESLLNYNQETMALRAGIGF